MSTLLFLERKNIYEHVSKYQKMHAKSNLMILFFLLPMARLLNIKANCQCCVELPYFTMRNAFYFEVFTLSIVRL